MFYPTQKSKTQENSATNNNLNTSDWNLYSNDTGYSIKYPQEYVTQNIAAGAGTMEALSNSRHITIHNKNASERYLERILEIQLLGLEPTYSTNAQVTNVMLGDVSAKKVTKKDSPSDTYYVTIDDENILEIRVPNSETNGELVSSILSTIELN